MIIETKEIYKCEYCRRLYQLKRFCVQHEISCTKNPENKRDCFECKHLNKKEAIVYFDTYGHEVEHKVDLFHCNKFDTFLYPPKVERKKNWFETDPKENNPMPIHCPMKSTTIDLPF